jgi:RIO-like serine/threonine protein kinase
VSKIAVEKILKKDLFGEVRYQYAADGNLIVRDASKARPWLRWLARRLLRREAQVLACLAPLDGVPDLVSVGSGSLIRSFIEGQPMQEAKPRDPAFFKAAARLLRRLHAANIVHNDLAKEPNILVRADGQPAFIDFQLALVSTHRTAWFRALAYEDLRHLLKHKRSYCAAHLTRREQAILAAPGWPSRITRYTLKPAYLLITRKFLGWADREGATDRGRQA